MSLTSQIRYVRALDSAATDGSGKTGLVFGSITAAYLTEGGTLTSLTTQTITTLGTYQAPTDAAHIRIKELAGSDPTKGVYEVHFHNTQVLSTGVKLWLFLSATGAAFQPLEMDLMDDLTATEKASVQTAADAAITANALVLEIEADTDALTAGVFVSGIANGTISSGTFLSGGVNVIAIASDATAATNLATAAHTLDANKLLRVDVEDWKGAVAPANTGDAYARLGAPAGASVSADVAAIKTDLDGGVTLTSAERTALSNALLDLANGIETGITLRQAQRAQLAMLAGVIGGAQSGTEVFKNPAGGTTRVTVTVDAQGNRTAVATNL